MRLQPIRRHRNEISSVSGDPTSGREHGVQRDGRSGRVEDTGRAVLRTAHQPLREVADVDQLHLRVRHVGDEHLVVRAGRMGETQRPVAGAVGGVLRAGQQTGPGDQVRFREGLCDKAFAGHLARTVLLGRPVVTVPRLEQGGTFVSADGLGTDLLVDIDGGDEQPSIGTAAERVQRCADMQRVAGHIDHRVELADEAVVPVRCAPLAPDEFGPVDHRPARATGETDHLMTGVECSTRGCSSEEGRTAEDEESHDLMSAGFRPTDQDVSLWAHSGRPTPV